MKRSSPATCSLTAIPGPPSASFVTAHHRLACGLERTRRMSRTTDPLRHAWNRSPTCEQPTHAFANTSLPSTDRPASQQSLQALAFLVGSRGEKRGATQSRSGWQRWCSSPSSPFQGWQCICRWVTSCQPGRAEARSQGPDRYRGADQSWRSKPPGMR